MSKVICLMSFCLFNSQSEAFPLKRINKKFPQCTLAFILGTPLFDSSIMDAARASGAGISAGNLLATKIRNYLSVSVYNWPGWYLA